MWIVGVLAAVAMLFACSAWCLRSDTSYSRGGRHRARKGTKSMKSWDDTSPLPLAEIAKQSMKRRFQ